MLPEQIGRDRAARLLPGSASVREFAASEFPREDCHWVATRIRPSAPRAGAGGVWARLMRVFRTPESESEAESAPEPVPA
jgi:hypothetical protein